MIEVCRSGRTDWTKEANEKANTADSSGNENFFALLARLHGKGSVLTQAERAAWKVLSDNGFAWGVGRKPKEG
jgi:hypothetical protein